MVTDVRAEFGRATALHREGRLDEAVDIYRRLLKARPGVFDVQRLLVLGLLQGGKAKEAHAVARKAREGHPSNPHAHVMMGATLQAEGRWERALAAFEAATVLDPGLVEAHYLAGNMLANLGRHAEAAARYDRTLALDPRAVEARANRSVALSLLGRPDEALADCEKLTELQPWEPRHFLSKASTLLELGRFAEAAAAADSALKLKPNLADALFLKGQGLLGQADLEGARQTIAAALNVAPDRPVFQATLARLERHLGNREAARDLCEKVLARGRAAAPVWQELAEVRRELLDLPGALAAANSALEIEPALASALTTKARLLADLGRPQDVRSLVDKALEADRTFPMALYLRGTENLADGRWAEGWAGYESRSSFLPPPYRPLPFTRWDGGATPGELIILGEQGIGDLIMFGRLLRLVADRGIRARFLTAAQNVPLLSRIDARVPVIGDLAQVDTSRPDLRWIPLASLPGLIAADPAEWPRPPYLTAEPERVARWRSLRGDGLLVGIYWQGNPSPAVDIGRSIPLEAYAPLAAIPGVTLVSLQQGAGIGQLDGCSFADRILRLPEGWDADGTYLDTAALLQHLDLVVTSDTSMAHLAGARDIPTFLALRVAPDWRWGRSGDACPLYPRLRLYRQQTAGDWHEVFGRIAGAVGEMAARAAR